MGGGGARAPPAPLHLTPVSSIVNPFIGEFEKKLGYLIIIDFNKVRILCLEKLW